MTDEGRSSSRAKGCGVSPPSASALDLRRATTGMYSSCMLHHASTRRRSPLPRSKSFARWRSPGWRPSSFVSVCRRRLQEDRQLQPNLWSDETTYWCSSRSMPCAIIMAGETSSCRRWLSDTGAAASSSARARRTLWSVAARGAGKSMLIYEEVSITYLVRSGQKGSSLYYLPPTPLLGPSTYQSTTYPRLRETL